MTEQAFQFEISLSVLNHLGRNLYRNFATVLGEAVSNSWDANARNVWIEINREAGSFSIRDDGDGMDAVAFQEKFLKVGYSKRKDIGETSPVSGRPFIGAKGIGKLAMLSCAQRVSVFSKVAGGEIVGGVIDNAGLDEAIKQDMVPDDYALEELDLRQIETVATEFETGTIIVFENVKDEIRNSAAYLKKLLAMNFHFCLSADEFSIHLNGDQVTYRDLGDLLGKTEFCWIINGFDDVLTAGMHSLKSRPVQVTSTLDLGGFIATVEKPRDAKIAGTDERASVDLFVNGRLREKNILRHIPTQRILESYIYGQLHFNSMDSEGNDPFTSSREGVLEDDPNFRALLDFLKRELVPKILDEWDAMRLDRGQEGDEENPRKSKKDRKARDLYAAASDDFKPQDGSAGEDDVTTWLRELHPDAEFNLAAYADCYLAENLVRRYIDNRAIALPTSAQNEIGAWQTREQSRKNEANISFEIRENADQLSYLGMDTLAFVAEGERGDSANPSLWRDAVRYRPTRNAVGHTGRLSMLAKNDLRSVFENIKARVRNLLSINT